MSSSRKKKSIKGKGKKSTDFNFRETFIFENRFLIASLFGIYFLLYLFISYCYPFPYFDPDTGTYILSARYEKISGYRPFGYSAFLQFFNYISQTASFVYATQYWFMAISGITLLLSVKRYFPPQNKWLFYALSFFFIASPSTLYISTWLMSDSLFISLSWLWLASLFFLLKSDWNIKWILMFLIHLFLMYWIIYIRYAGVVFPMVSTVAFIFRYKWLGLCMAPLSFFLAFYLYQDAKNANKKHYDYATYSGFSGWLKANNALSIIPYTDIKPQDFKDPNLQKLHQFVLNKPDSIFTTRNVMTANFMWLKDFPLKQFFFHYFNLNKDKKTYLYVWSYLGDVYNDYGNTLIKKHPFLYFKHFLWLNFERVFYMNNIHVLLKNNESTHTDERVTGYYTDIEKDSTTKAHLDIYGNYFNGLYLKWINVLKWLAILGTLIFLFIKRKEIYFNEYQKFAFISMVVLNILYIGMIVAVVPVIPRLMLVTYASQMILIYCVFNAYFTHQNQSKNLVT